MAEKLYMTPTSPPVRAVLCTAKALGVELELIEVNLLEAEHMTPEYIKVSCKVGGLLDITVNAFHFLRAFITDFNTRPAGHNIAIIFPQGYQF